MALFISYRREDSAGSAGRLFDGLAAAFGADAVFLDVTDIGAGTDFVEQLERSLEQTSLLLAVIGPNWLTLCAPGGGRRIDDERDFLRLELATALRRGVPIFPVLVEGARMPLADQLPPPLQELARRQAVELRHERWNADMEMLIAGIHRAAPIPAGQRRPHLRRTLGTVLLILLLVALTGGMAWAWRHRPVSTRDYPRSSTNPPPARPGSVEALLAAEDAREVFPFGAVEVGRRSEEVRIRVVNRGAEPAAVRRAGVFGDHAADYALLSGCDGRSLVTGESCELSLRFQPTTTGPRTASISVEYAGRNSPLILRLFGQGR